MFGRKNWGRFLTFGRVIGAALVVYCFFLAMFILETLGEYSYPGEPELAREYIPPNEDEATRRLIRRLKLVLEDMYPGEKRTKRDAHPKQHGLVRAEFIIPDDLPSDLRVGLFEQPGRYESWIRFSSLMEVPDTQKIAKGMGVKVMGVPGRKVLAGHRDEGSHDFVFMSTPVFVTKDVEGFADFVDALASGTGPTLGHFVTHPRTTYLFNKTGQATPDILDVEWGSTTPYRFGDRAVKYAVRVREPGNADMPQGEDQEDFLRQRLADRLSQQDVWLDFFVQFQLDPKSMPIEDPRVVWKSPLVQIASIRIPQQTFDTRKQQCYGDTLSFTPWHALPEHRPLGGINRGRRLIYSNMSKFRHERNAEPLVEPESWRDFERYIPPSLPNDETC